MVRRVQGEGLLSRVRAEKGFLPPQITEVGQDHWRSPSVTPPMTLPPPGLREPGETPQSFQRKALEPENGGSRISDYAEIQLRVGFSDNSQPYFRFLRSAIKAVIVNY